jgi:hypothetical protein
MSVSSRRYNPEDSHLRFFLLVPASRPALGPTQLPVQWLPVVISPGVMRGRGVTLTTHPHLGPRLKMSRSYTFSPPNASMACSGTAYLYLSLTLSLLGSKYFQEYIVLKKIIISYFLLKTKMTRSYTYTVQLEQVLFCKS